MYTLNLRGKGSINRCVRTIIYSIEIFNFLFSHRYSKKILVVKDKKKFFDSAMFVLNFILNKLFEEDRADEKVFEEVKRFLP